MLIIFTSSFRLKHIVDPHLRRTFRENGRDLAVLRIDNIVHPMSGRQPDVTDRKTAIDANDPVLAVDRHPVDVMSGTSRRVHFYSLQGQGMGDGVGPYGLGSGGGVGSGGLAIVVGLLSHASLVMLSKLGMLTIPTVDHVK